jgi:hypothetical protein
MGLSVMRMVPLDVTGYIRIDSLITADRYFSCGREQGRGNDKKGEEGEGCEKGKRR